MLSEFKDIRIEMFSEVAVLFADFPWLSLGHVCSRVALTVNASVLPAHPCAVLSCLTPLSSHIDIVERLYFLGPEVLKGRLEHPGLPWSSGSGLLLVYRS